MGGMPGAGGFALAPRGSFPDLRSRLPLSPCAPLGVPLVGPGVSLGVAQLGIVLAPPRLVVSLSSFVGVRLSFYRGERQDDRDEMGITFLLLLLFVHRYRKTLAGHVLSLDR